MSDNSTTGLPKTSVRGAPPIKAAADDLATIVRMIENGEEPRKIFSSIVECASALPGVGSAAIFLPTDKSSDDPEMIASTGDFVQENDRRQDTGKSGLLSAFSMAASSNLTISGVYNYFDIVCLGAPIGALVTVAPGGISAEAAEKLPSFAHHAGVVFERQRLSSTLQHFLDRLQILNELNQLIASNVGVQRIVKSLAREGAFRFAADISLAFVISEGANSLLLKGGYGCGPHAVPKEISLDTGTLGQVMRVGGHLSIPNLQNCSNHGLDFLQELGVKSVDVCCLEVRGEPMGSILLGFKRETIMSQYDTTRFEEFAQGAAVAVANARTQERITSYTEKLEELVEQRTSDLAVQTSRAEEANRAKSQFLANMSHELRTPLTAIVGYASVLADGIFGPLNPKQNEALNAVCRSSEHLKNLIDDVLNLARIESGKEEAKPVQVQVKDVLLQAHKLMLQSAISKGVELSPMALTPEIIAATLYVDQKHIHQIIINLMSNAVKYTPKGGKVRLEAEIMSDMVKICVTDTGVGIPPNKLAKLFERFERGEDSYSRSQEGTGIGLNLTRSLVDLNGGRIGVESQEGRGSTFWVMMPLASVDRVAITKPELSETKIRLDGLSALVVDDNKDTCEVLKHILLSVGATVTMANTVKEAISELGQAVPDIVLTDLAIPGESGLVLINHIRNANGPLARLPIIVLSAAAFQSDKDAALSAGASIFIPKPFKPADVTRNVRQLTFKAAIDPANYRPV